MKIFTYGRFNPPHKGHEMMIQKIINTAKELGGTPVIVVSHRHLTENGRNPLNVNTKLRYLRNMFPNVEFKDSRNKSIAKIVESFKNNSIMFHGKNRFKKNGTSEFEFLRKSGVKKFMKSGNRDPNAEGLTGYSATAVRAAAKRGDKNAMKKLMSNKLKNNINNIITKLQNAERLRAKRPRTARTPTPSAKRPRRTAKRSPQ
jgi:nicotinamide mononucleotide adenylyltransferase